MDKDLGLLARSARPSRSVENVDITFSVHLSIGLDKFCHFVNKSLMATTEEKLLDASVEVISRYGLRRTSMADIAQAAGVSRQSVYAKFGSKEGLIAAAMAHVWCKSLTELDAAFAATDDLGAKLDAFFETLIVPFFEAMQAMPDLEDLLKGMSDKTKGGADDAARIKRERLAGQLRPHAATIAARGQTVEGLARFIEMTASSFKYSATSVEELRTLLTTLKIAVLQMVQQDDAA